MFRLFILIRVLHKKGKAVLTRLTEGFPAVTLFCKITAEGEEGPAGSNQNPRGSPLKGTASLRNTGHKYSKPSPEGKRTENDFMVSG